MRSHWIEAQQLMTNFREVAESLPTDQISRMRDALETGKWPDGQAVTQAQRNTTYEAVMLWEARHLPPEERMGYIPPRPSRLGSTENRIPVVNPDEH